MDYDSSALPTELSRQVQKDNKMRRKEQLEKPYKIEYLSSSMTATTPSIEQAFAACQQITRDHYENFPVASLLLPARQRPFVAAVYAFARTADDFADEGSLPPAERLARLDDWQHALERAYKGEADHPIFIALAETAARTGIPQKLFTDLLTAFRMDVQKKRYRNFQEILEYCRFSANPVGRIVLHLFNEVSPEKLHWSDQICTGLQLANFWQDVRVDMEKDRIYLPLEDLSHFEYTEDDLRAGRDDRRFRDLIEFQVRRARGFLVGGRPLVSAVGFRLRLELALTVRGGLAILDAVERSREGVVRVRPHLTTMNKLLLLGGALFDTARWTAQRP
jgi:hydroxysqualene synthase